MLNSKIKLSLFIFSFVFALYAYQGCDGIFPTQTKPGIPPDHTANYGGFYHIQGVRNGNEADECNDCHGVDLRGQLYNYNGTWVITSSCYQCHGNIWEEGVGEGRKP